MVEEVADLKTVKQHLEKGACGLPYGEDTHGHFTAVRRVARLLG